MRGNRHDAAHLAVARASAWALPYSALRWAACATPSACCRSTLSCRESQQLMAPHHVK